VQVGFFAAPQHAPRLASLDADRVIEAIAMEVIAALQP